MMRPSWIAAGASVLAVLCGCAASPKADFYTLSPAVVPVDTPPAGPIAVLITVVTVPDLVDRPQIVVRSGDNKVDIGRIRPLGRPIEKSDPARGARRPWPVAE